MNQQMGALAQGDNTPVVLVGSSNLEVKEVEFLGDSILAVKENEKVYVGVGYICKGIGLNKSQKDTQVQNIQSDLVLKRGCLKFQAGVIDKNNEVLAIDIDYLPMWLAKISITPKMKEQQPEVVEKLVEYQLKAKDVLAQAFVHKADIDISKYSPEMQAILMHDEKLTKVENRVNTLENNMFITRGQKKKIRDFISDVVKNTCGSKYSNAYKELKNKVYSEVYRKLYNHFEITSFEEIPRIRFQEALNIINAYKPTKDLELMIKGANHEVPDN